MLRFDDTLIIIFTIIVVIVNYYFYIKKKTFLHLVSFIYFVKIITELLIGNKVFH